MNVKRYSQRVSGSGITGDEFQYIETVPASDYDALAARLAEAERDAIHWRRLHDIYADTTGIDAACAIRHVKVLIARVSSPGGGGEGK